MQTPRVLSESELSPRRLMWRRFRRHRRGYWSLVTLVSLYVLSLFAGWICVDPYAPLDVEEFEPYRTTTVTVRPVSRVQRLQVARDGTVLWKEGSEFFDSSQSRPFADSSGNPFGISPELDKAVAARFRNESCPAVTLPCGWEAEVRLPAYAPREKAPDSVRIIVRDPVEWPVETFHDGNARLKTLAKEHPQVQEAMDAARTGFVPEFTIPWEGGTAVVGVDCPPVSWPFRPVAGHWLGTDMAGRDVFSRLLHGLRISLTFGMLLVAASLLLGVFAGAVQGYFAGWTDLVGQRLTEIWSAVPFLYVMILLGNTFGRSFALLLFCYAIFNWVGLSAYVRAEFLKLRVRPFVDAARTQGLGHLRIMMRHILPNALTPLITLVPFELVGAIGSLAALDYLGFGLPDGTPSWGDLLHQAQMVHRQAWWLILYPSLALFTVMLLGVFVGEGMREAFDPRSRR